MVEFVVCSIDLLVDLGGDFLDGGRHVCGINDIIWSNLM